MSKSINVHVQADRVVGKQDHLWRWIGYDECNYTYIPEGIELLKKFSALGDAPYYFRTHFTFCTGNCHGTYKFGSTNLYHEDAAGNPVYDFTWYDKIIDAYLETGNKPFIELGFMPMDLMSMSHIMPQKNMYGFHEVYKAEGWTCPPKDYDKWHALIETLCRHLLERYGEAEIKTWYFELWNEPDSGYYWRGTDAEYCKLYDYTEHALHSVLPDARLGGPSSVGLMMGKSSFFRFFLDHCKNGANYYTQQKGTRLDYVTFHVKGGGWPFQIDAPKTNPCLEVMIDTIRKYLDIMKEYGYDDREVIMSETDPDGWAAGGCYDNQNAIFRNTEYYATYIASSYEKIDELAQQYHMVIRPLAWAFMFPGERCFEGTRVFSTQGIDKAVLNMFRIYGQLGDEKLAFHSDGAEGLGFLKDFKRPAMSYTGEGEDTDVSGFAVHGKHGETQIIVYSHCNDRDQQADQVVHLTVEGLTASQVTVSHYRIDDQHSNAYAEWVRQGSPLYPKGEQYDAIKARDGLEKFCDDQTVTPRDGKLELSFPMPSHGVSFLTIQ